MMFCVRACVCVCACVRVGGARVVAPSIGRGVCAACKAEQLSTSCREVLPRFSRDRSKENNKSTTFFHATLFIWYFSRPEQHDSLRTHTTSFALSNPKSHFISPRGRGEVVLAYCLEGQKRPRTVCCHNHHDRNHKSGHDGGDVSPDCSRPHSSRHGPRFPSLQPRARKSGLRWGNHSRSPLRFRLAPWSSTRGQSLSKVDIGESVGTRVKLSVELW